MYLYIISNHGELSLWNDRPFNQRIYIYFLRITLLISVSERVAPNSLFLIELQFKVLWDNSPPDLDWTGLDLFLSIALILALLILFLAKRIVPFPLLSLGSSRLYSVYSFLDIYFEVHRNLKKMPVWQKSCW